MRTTTNDNASPMAHREAGLSVVGVMIATVIMVVAMLAFSRTHAQAFAFTKKQASASSSREVEEGMQAVLSQLTKSLTTGGACRASLPSLSVPVGSTGLKMTSFVPFTAPADATPDYLRALARCASHRTPAGASDYHFCVSFTPASGGAATQAFAGARYAFAEVEIQFIDSVSGARGACASYAKSHPAVSGSRGGYLAEAFYGFHWTSRATGGESIHASSGATYVSP